ncbi:DNA-binding protein [Frankia sp. Mgl5]|uniref:DNA-binding protein n=1 Tax=Frankia sp. Mgl5 TaxID=2933793 RepID=UPI00200DDB8F|nr:DNA-binding protein [Frankia sp. Mgl5]MCK9929343.1 DNA-binding protein [Frankia sp. Mgl5]
MTKPLRLMAAGEIATALGVGAARVHAIIKDPKLGFPDPVDTLKVGKIWLAEDVEEWMRAHGRTPTKEKTDA